MNNQVSNALAKTGVNLLKTAGALVITTVASNTLRDQTNQTIRSATESYGKIREAFSERRSIEG